MKVELKRFRIREGKEARVAEWLQTLNDRMPEAIAALGRQQIHAEVIFWEQIEDRQFLSWFFIREDSSTMVGDSPHALDRLHLAFWRECIDPSYGHDEAHPEVVMIAPHMAAAMEWDRADVSAAGLQDAPPEPEGGDES